MTLSIPHEVLALDSKTCWSLLERVASSSQLKRAVRLRELLLFVGRRSLKDGCIQVREQEIGIEVFGRLQAYDTAVDNIVRTNVSDLRKRIEAYFDGEGLQEPVIMEIPRGSYIPVFRYRPVDPRETAEPEEMAVAIGAEPLAALPEARQDSAVGRGAQNLKRIATTAAFCILAACCVALWIENRADQKSLHPWRYSPAVADLWSGFFDTHHDADIVLSDSSFLLIQSMNEQSFSFNDYLSRGYLSHLQAERLSSDKSLALSLFTSKSLGNSSEFRLAQRIQALEPGSKTLRLYNAREYIPALLRQDSVILIGSKISNPWVELFDNRLNFALAADFSHPQTVTNRTPTVGEQSAYTVTDTSGYAVGYCAIAYLPNTGQNGKVLLIEGTSSEATEAGGEFLLSEDQLSNFQRTLHAAKFPYFEVLLKTSQVRNTPITATIVAYRIYPNLH
ncbi:hypothetical protein [Granulicella arctica]|uniref:Adenylate cyclase n=1 Tax=Granulicella arctica TaxID=940613 RepID=A0A7Y9TF47_9BACT|nr:hypothetical protein [Granulicella arctica]NYF77949.1 hypothetical protein [Granulicella arctica]